MEGRSITSTPGFSALSALFGIKNYGKNLTYVLSMLLTDRCAAVCCH